MRPNFRTVTKRIDFCIGHRLLQYEGPCRNLHGHNLTLDLEVAHWVTTNPHRADNAPEDARVALDLNRSGFVCDFRVVKDIAKEWINAHLDHAFVASEFDRDLLGFLARQEVKYFPIYYHEMEEALREFGLTISGDFERSRALEKKYGKNYSLEVALTNPTMENLALIIADNLQREFDASIHGVRVVSVTLSETSSGWVTLRLA